MLPSFIGESFLEFTEVLGLRFVLSLGIVFFSLFLLISVLVVCENCAAARVLFQVECIGKVYSRLIGRDCKDN